MVSYISNQKSFPFLSQTIHFYSQFLEPIFASLGGSKNQNSTKYENIIHVGCLLNSAVNTAVMLLVMYEIS